MSVFIDTAVLPFRPSVRLSSVSETLRYSVETDKQCIKNNFIVS